MVNDGRVCAGLYLFVGQMHIWLMILVVVAKSRCVYVCVHVCVFGCVYRYCKCGVTCMVSGIVCV